MKKKFLRSEHNTLKRLGSGKKWRKPRGRDNKMRETRAGHSKLVEIGRRSPKDQRGKFEGKEIIRIKNISELKKLEGMDLKDKVIVSGRLGKKKKQELKEVAKKVNIKILNIK